MDSRRHLKAHKKSRKGCGECKLRKVKCDEGKPACTRCLTGHLLCRYGSNNSLVELVVNSVESSMAFDGVAFAINSLGSPKPGTYTFRPEDVRLLNTFRKSTALTVTTNRSRALYQNEIIEIARTFPFLMHTILALTKMHERFSKGLVDSPPTYEESVHRWRSTALFQARLATQRPSQEATEAAAIWVAAILIGTITFGSVESLNPEEIWPLSQSSPITTSWFAMNEGKYRLLPMVQVLRMEAAYQGLFPPQSSQVQRKSSPEAELSILPRCLLELCDLTIFADDSNPYHCATAALAASLRVDTISGLLIFWGFVQHVPAQFRKLLQEKDPRALLLLAIWFARLHKMEIWWLQPRTTVEGHAICIYLRRYHGNDRQLQQALHTIRRDHFEMLTLAGSTI